jgi:hypothetical protein
MGIISVTGLKAKDPRVATFVVEVYADSALTNLLDVLTAPSTYDQSTGNSYMIGSMTFTGLTEGTTYYLQSCTVIPGFGRGNYSSVYSIAAGADTGSGSGGLVTFGSGPPSGSGTDGDMYFDTSGTSYALYVYHSAGWHAAGSGGGSGGGVFSSGSNANGNWVQDPTGHIHQWGVVTTDLSGGTHVVTFPTAFSSSTGISVNVSTKSPTDRITYVVDGSVSSSSFTVGNNGSSGFVYWEADGPGVASGTGLADPMTTEGDLIYRHSGAADRLAIGIAGTVLTSDGTDPAWSALPLEIGFGILSGVTGTTVSPGRLRYPRAGKITKCVVVVNASDASVSLAFKIKQNGTDIFSSDPTVSAATPAGSVVTFTALTSTPLAVSAGDIFTMDITTGSSSWSFTAQLEA